MNKGNEILIKKATLIKIAIDMHLRNYRVVRQIDHSGSAAGAEVYPGGLLRLAGEAAEIGRASGGVLRGGLLWV